MHENINKKYIYLNALLGAGALMLLRICDKADVFSVLLVMIGLTALVCSMRHACAITEYLFLAGLMALTYAFRFYGYTGDPASDLILGPLVGLIMYALLGVECLFKRFRDSFLYSLIFPAAYLLFLYFTEMVKINMPFRMDTYLSCFPVLCQIASRLGIYSIDFLLAWTASVIVFLIDHRRAEQGIRLAAAYAIVLFGVLGFGMMHMHKMNLQESEKNDTVRVACATGPYCGTLSDDSYTSFTMEETLESFTGIMEAAAEQNAEILVFSEEAYGILDVNEETLLEKAKELAAGYDMHLLLAYEVADTDGSEGGKGINKLCWISNEGEILYDYTKHCIIPVIETSEYVRGDKNIESFEINVHGKNLQAAAAICYDADFDIFMSHMENMAGMEKNVDLLFLPTWDWKVIAEEHFGVARLRAIQTETTLVRSVYDGWSAVIDSAGNVLERENTNEIGYEKVFICEVPVR